MKSGIYKTPNGNLIYVAKDRTIKAASLTPSTWPGTKVSHRAKDDTVVIEGTEYRCTRYADVPNGCNDAQAFLNKVFAQRGPYRIEAVDSAIDAARSAAKGTVNAYVDSYFETRSRLKSEGFRFCHSQSARKHRRRGREVRYVPEVGAYAWRAAA